jgi:Transposase IS66 family
VVAFSIHRPEIRRRPTEPVPFPASPSQTGHEVLLHPAFPQAVDRPHSPTPLRLATQPKHTMMVSLLPALAKQFPVVSTPGYWSFASARLCCPRRHRYYYRLRLPLDTPPLPGATGYRFRRYHSRRAGSPATSVLASRRISPVSSVGCACIPLPLRRRVLRCCNSKVFAPSVAFARPSGLGSRCFRCCGEVTALQDSLHATDCALARRPRRLGRDASTARISPSAGHQLHGCLVITVTGLSPASPLRLIRTHEGRPPSLTQHHNQQHDLLHRLPPAFVAHYRSDTARQERGADASGSGTFARAAANLHLWGRAGCIISVRSVQPPVQRPYRRATRDAAGIHGGGADETGWRIDAERAWLRVCVGDTVTVYDIAPGRGYGQAKQVLGEDFTGVLERNGWAAYGSFAEATYQTCLAHLLRRCHELLEVARGGQATVPGSYAGFCSTLSRLATNS